MAGQQKNQRKYGRNAAHCKAYTAEHRHEKSHIRRIKAHLARYGFSKDAKEALMRYAGQVSLKAFQSAEQHILCARVSVAKHIKPRYHGVAMGGTATA